MIYQYMKWGGKRKRSKINRITIKTPKTKVKENRRRIKNSYLKISKSRESANARSKTMNHSFKNYQD